MICNLAIPGSGLTFLASEKRYEAGNIRFIGKRRWMA